MLFVCFWQCRTAIAWSELLLSTQSCAKIAVLSSSNVLHFHLIRGTKICTDKKHGPLELLFGINNSGLIAQSSLKVCQLCRETSTFIDFHHRSALQPGKSAHNAKKMQASCKNQCSKLKLEHGNKSIALPMMSQVVGCAIPSIKSKCAPTLCNSTPRISFSETKLDCKFQHLFGARRIGACGTIATDSCCAESTRIERHGFSSICIESRHHNHQGHTWMT